MNSPLLEKAVVLARGLGTRMRREDSSVALDARRRAAAETGLKAMIPIERPFLDYVLSALADAGCRRVCLVVAPDHEEIRHYYQQVVRPRRLRIELAVQTDPKGTADAVLAAEEFAGDDPFLTVNSDNYYPREALRALKARNGSAVALFERETMIADGNIAEDRVRQFAVARIDDRGLLERIVEKPDEGTLSALPRPHWISMNCWRFGPSIFKACRRIAPSSRGELEVPDAVQYAIDVLGETFRAITVRAAVLDLTSRQDIEPVAAKLAGMEVEL